MNRAGVALCMSLCIAQVATAQRSTLVVTVGDAGTNDFIRNAQVVLVESNVARRTDIVGQAHFGALPPGVYRVRARSLGYAPLEMSVDVRNQDSVEVRLGLVEEGDVASARNLREDHVGSGADVGPGPLDGGVVLGRVGAPDGDHGEEEEVDDEDGDHAGTESVTVVPARPSFSMSA